MKHGKVGDKNKKGRKLRREGGEEKRVRLDIAHDYWGKEEILKVETAWQPRKKGPAPGIKVRSGEKKKPGNGGKGRYQWEIQENLRTKTRLHPHAKTTSLHNGKKTLRAQKLRGYVPRIGGL